MSSWSSWEVSNLWPSLILLRMAPNDRFPFESALYRNHNKSACHSYQRALERLTTRHWCIRDQSNKGLSSNRDSIIQRVSEDIYCVFRRRGVHYLHWQTMPMHSKWSITNLIGNRGTITIDAKHNKPMMISAECQLFDGTVSLTIEMTNTGFHPNPSFVSQDAVPFTFSLCFHQLRSSMSSDVAPFHYKASHVDPEREREREWFPIWYSPIAVGSFYPSMNMNVT